MINPRKQSLTEQISQKLINLRKERNLTQENVRFDLDINIGRIECGKHLISIETLDRLLKYYGVTFAEFFEDID